MALFNKSEMIVTLLFVFLGGRQSNRSKNFPLASPATCHIQKAARGFVPYRCHSLTRLQILTVSCLESSSSNLLTVPLPQGAAGP